MCMPRGLSDLMLQQTGKPCPREVLDEDNEPAAALLPFVLNEDMRGLAPAYADALFQLHGLGPEDRALTLQRVHHTAHDPQVTREIEMQSEAERQRREAERNG